MGSRITQGYNLLEKADALVPLLDVQFLIYRQRSLSMDTLMADVGPTICPGRFALPMSL